MSSKTITLLLIVLNVVLVGIVITFSFYHPTDHKLLTGSLVFSLSLLLMLIVQLRQIKSEQ